MWHKVPDFPTFARFYYPLPQQYLQLSVPESPGILTPSYATPEYRLLGIWATRLLLSGKAAPPPPLSMAKTVYPSPRQTLTAIFSRHAAKNYAILCHTLPYFVRGHLTTGHTEKIFRFSFTARSPVTQSVHLASLTTYPLSLIPNHFALTPNIVHSIHHKMWFVK